MHVLKYLDAVICYCEGYCPNNKENGTCILKRGAQCFSAVEEIYNTDTRAFEAFRTFGCLPPDEQSLMQCKGDLVPHMYGKSIKCCNFTDLCNKNLFPEYKPHTTVPPPLFFLEKDVPYVALLVSFTVCVTVAFLLITFFYFRYRKKEEDSCKKIKILNKIDHSSGSGIGDPLLVQRTIAKQIQMVRAIGKGRYSEVWLGYWESRKVAVKKFFTSEESSWRRETEIFKTVIMRHENVLAFIAADIQSLGCWTQMLLITEYHETGSLYNYLQVNVLDETALWKLAKSAACGIAHLHTEVNSVSGKPAVAHRDIKSKNFLINKKGECVIADFGLSVTYKSSTNCLDIGIEGKVGTRRYMPPEVLDGTIDKLCFDSFKMADIYSLGLVFWEMCRRCVTMKRSSDGSVCSYRIEDAALPYYDVVPDHPSLDEMLEVVVTKKMRPFVPARWNENSVLSVLAKTIQECWHENPSTRLPILRIKKRLEKLVPESTTIQHV